MSKKNNQNNKQNLTAARLDAIVILMVELTQQLCKDETSVQNARQKVASVLIRGGLTQERVGKLLGIQKKKVVEASRKIKI